MKRTCAILVLCLGLVALQAGEHTPLSRPFVHGLFTDHMVLQRGRACPVWGWTTPGAQVTVSMAGRSATAVAGADGAWMARIGPFPPGGPHELTLSGPQQLRIADVLVGDVWLASGQSNMEMGIKGVTEWWHEVSDAATSDAVRLAIVLRGAAYAPPATLPVQWRASRGGAADESINHGGFSAIGLMFARQLQRETGVPVGIIQSAWGATAIRSWSSPEALVRQGDTAAADPRRDWEQRLQEAWERIDPAAAAQRDWPSAPAGAEWTAIDLPAAWPHGFAGVAWFRTEVELPPTLRGRELDLALGAISGSDTAWCNGRFIGAGGGDGVGRQWPRHYRIPADACPDGRARIVVRVLGERFLGKAGDLALRAAGTDPLPLAAWRCRMGTPRDQLKGQPPEVRDTPAGCYQAMIRPLAPFAVAGALWYQGEGNVGNAQTYRRALTDLVADWRALFGPDMPFYIVQLAGFGPQPAQPGDSGWARVREAQAQVASGVPGCGLAVAIDRGAIFNIHPPDKQDVARRLALLALARLNGKAVEDQGPTFTGLARDGAALRLSFSHATGLRSLGGGPTGFAIAGADKRFVWAQARLDGEAVVVSDPAVPEPVAVRYGWADHPLCNLSNRDGLPAVPFRSDDW